MKIKICGIRTPGDASAVNEAIPDYVGFILSDGFKRSVDEITAGLISKFVDPQIGRVGVFVDDDPARIKRLVYNGLIDIVQLHGNESDDDIKDIKSGGASIIKVFDASGDLDMKKVMKCPADMVMFDPGKGAGKSFDWEKVKDCKRPFFLAGGIGPDNIDEALDFFKGSNLFCLDMSSLVEKGGVKSEELCVKAVSIAHA